MTLDLEHLRQWIGRTEEAADVVTAAPLAGLSATLDRDDPEPVPGDPVPPAGHWLYFLPRTRHSELDGNGHARTGGFLPPVPLSRRMWAGGRIRFEGPLRVGDPIRRLSEIADVTAKEGKTGPLVFVLVRHEISGPEGVAIVEEHDIVYRDEPPPDAPSAESPDAPSAKPSDVPSAKPPSAPEAPGEAVWQRRIDPDPVLLFRYSALIFNGHRIHYDRDYVTREEGYPGLIVHGPLIATLLMDLCRREAPKRPLSRFDYRARRPIFDQGPFTVAGCPADGGKASLWALDQQGRVAMTAEADFAGG